MERAPWWRGKRGEWYVAAQMVLLGLIAVAPLAPGQPGWPGGWSLAARGVGVGLMGVGAVLAAAGLVRLGGNLSPLPHPKEDAVLVESGVYGMVRHPIYGGLILGSLGWGLLTNSLWTLALAAALWVLFEFKAQREEAQLAMKFAGYADYRARVRKFIPFIY
jgi:protein-S-isoprenylcysteine O-methyltransferase Ste14